MFSKLNIAVVGDIMLDRYIEGEVERVSPEAPVPVVAIGAEKSFLGGAANVAHNIKVVESKVSLFGIFGEDEKGKNLKKILKEKDIDYSGCVTLKNHTTTVKTRIIAQGQQIVRLDREIVKPIEPEVERELLQSMSRKTFDAIVISDYGKGVITEGLVKCLCSLKKPIVVDPKVNHTHLDKNVTVITPNLREAELMSGIAIKDPQDEKRAAEKILKETNAKCVLITEGRKGMTLYSEDEGFHVDALAKEVYDVTGAGDTVVAMLIVGMAVGFSLRKVVTLANEAAAVVVEKKGTQVVSKKEVNEILKKI